MAPGVDRGWGKACSSSMSFSYPWSPTKQIFSLLYLQGHLQAIVWSLLHYKKWIPRYQCAWTGQTVTMMTRRTGEPRSFGGAWEDLLREQGSASPSGFPSHRGAERIHTQGGVGRKWSTFSLSLPNAAEMMTTETPIWRAEWLWGKEEDRTETKVLLWVGRMCPDFHKSSEPCHGFHWTVSSKSRNQRQILSPSWTGRCCLVCSASRFSEFLTISVHLKWMATEAKRMRNNVIMFFENRICPTYPLTQRPKSMGFSYSRTHTNGNDTGAIIQSHTMGHSNRLKTRVQ